MLDFTSYLMAQKVTEQVVRDMQPNAPVAEHQETRPHRLRLRISLRLYRLADLISPVTKECQPVSAGSC